MSGQERPAGEDQPLKKFKKAAGDVIQQLRVPDVIAKKRDNGILSKEEIDFIVQGACNKKVGDSQLGAWLMAVYFNGLNAEETVNLTQSMLDSGAAPLEWPKEFAHLVVDKHSTGGVGDKISLPLAPALAACGAKVPMISGRGLGHTGGTLDKLESIPGFNVSLTEAQLKENVTKVGAVICGQTAEIAPADKRLYAIRDVTATVASLPLITASIVCKKAAEGLKALVLDVKTGRAAFMQKEEDSRALARSMVDVGNGLGIPTTAFITDMNDPIGHYVGNSVEILESIHCLQGKGPADLEELVTAFGGACLAQVGLASDQADGAAKIASSLRDGSALAKFKDMVIAQGGNGDVVDDPENILPKPAGTVDVKYDGPDGHVESIDALKLAKAIASLGSGRAHADDVLDMSVGCQIIAKRGAALKNGDVWVKVFYNKTPVTDFHIDQLQASLHVSTSAVDAGKRVIDILK